MKELLLSNGRVLGGKRGKRGTRLAKIPHPVMCWLCFFFQISRTNPSQNHLFASFVSVCLFWALIFFGVVRVLQCGTSPIRGRLLKSSLSCPCHLCLAFLTSKYVSCFTSPQCRQSGLCAAVLDGPDSISSRSVPLHTCTNVFVLHLHMPPHLVPCSVTPHFFFLAIPHLTATFLGCVGGSKACFRTLQGLPSEGMTPYHLPHTLLVRPPSPNRVCLSSFLVVERLFTFLSSLLRPPLPLFCPPLCLLSLFLPCFDTRTPPLIDGVRERCARASAGVSV
jgi:hypothetical protein